MTVYANPGTPGSLITFKDQYENFIGGQWVPPVSGEYMDNVTPVTGEVFCRVPLSQAADVELALDAAHEAKDAWGKTSPSERALILHRIADRMEENLEMLAVVDERGVSILLSFLHRLFGGDCNPAESFCQCGYILEPSGDEAAAYRVPSDRYPGASVHGAHLPLRMAQCRGGGHADLSLPLHIHAVYFREHRAVVPRNLLVLARKNL